jgi:protein-disulfide isomerase
MNRVAASEARDAIVTGCALLATISLIALPAWVWMSDRTSQAAQAEISPEGVSLQLDPTTTLGEGSATIGIVEFSDFQCTFCGSFAREVFPQIEREFVRPGVAKYAFRQYPLEDIHPMAFKMAQAAECARRQNAFQAMHNLLFADQTKFSDVDLIQNAQTLGMDTTAFEDCLRGDAGKRVNQDLDEGKRLGITGTPTFLVGEMHGSDELTVRVKIVGSRDFGYFKAVIEQLAAQTQR